MNNIYKQEDESKIDIKNLILTFWKNKFQISFITGLFVIFGIFYSLSLKNVYQSSAVLAPSSSSKSNLSNIASQFSGITSLAGFSIPSSGEVDKVAMGIEVIKSFNFYENFVNKHSIFFELEAANGWDSKKDILIINSDIYDVKLKKWVDESQFAVNGKPSMQMAHKNFIKNLDIKVDPKTRFVTISFKHYSPNIAKKIVELLITEINEISKSEDILVAQNSINFLRAESDKINYSSTLSSINVLIEKQLEVITFANATPEYLLKTLSPPIAPETKILPQRSLIVILCFTLGLMMSLLFILLKDFYLRKA